MISLDPVVVSSSGAPFEIQLEGTTGGAAGWDKVKVANESPFALKIAIGGDSHWLQAWTADVFSCAGQSVMRVAPSLLTGAVVPPSSSVLVTLALPGEQILGTYPVALNRQAAGFSAQQLLGTFGPNDTGLHDLTLPAGTHALLAEVWPAVTGTPNNAIALVAQQSYGWKRAGGAQAMLGIYVITPWPAAAEPKVRLQNNNAGQNVGYIAVLDPQVSPNVQLLDASGNNVFLGQQNDNNSLPVVAAAPSASNRAILTATAAWTQLLAANATRKGLLVVNNTNGQAFIGFGAGSVDYALQASERATLTRDQVTTQLVNGYISSAAVGAFTAIAAGLYVSELS